MCSTNAQSIRNDNELSDHICFSLLNKNQTVMKKNYHLGACACIALLLCLSGCGDPQVTGTITFSDGTPLTGGMLVLQDGANQGIGEVRHDGTFSVYQYRPGDGLRRGTYRGYIAGAAVADDQGRSTSLIPERYTDMETSGIVYDSNVNRGRLDIVIDALPPQR